jgi:hypothetical protein
MSVSLVAWRKVEMHAFTRALVLSLIVLVLAQPHAQEPPLRLAIAGLVHGHVSGFLRGAQGHKDVEIVGVFDADAALLRKYAESSTLSDSVLFTDLAAMIDRAKPEAIASFTNTFDHPAVVEAAAARRVHVMMEKPLAVSIAHAQRIRLAAEKGNIQAVVTREQPDRDRYTRSRARIGAHRSAREAGDGEALKAHLGGLHLYVCTSTI